MPTFVACPSCGCNNLREPENFAEKIKCSKCREIIAEAVDPPSAKAVETAKKQLGHFYTTYDLAERRRRPSKRQLAAHQKAALGKIGKRHESKPAPPRGGILVLPPGGGKTFTALYFICRYPLSQGYKVLWLAHTHHLLDQASSYFADLAGRIAEPKERLTVRVVSGAPE